MFDFKVGQMVETSTHQEGFIRYIGPLHVADGNWLGIELPESEGKNDGSVRGERYFTCAPAHGLFVKDTSIVRIIAQPPQRAPAKSAAKPAAAPTSAKTITTKARPSSVVAPKANPRLSTISKRQSVAASSTHTSLRAPIRKTSNAGTTATSAATPSTTSNSSKPLRDSNVETLQTKIRHLEKQHIDDQERLRELSLARDERDKFQGIIQKLQSKCQTQHQNLAEAMSNIQSLQSENATLSRNSQEHEVDLEDALIDKEMAEERAEQAEAELDMLRSKVEERDMELDILREEAELFTTEMSAEEREQAGYYRLQHENDRLREALITLKEMTGEQEQDFKARVRDLEGEVALLEASQQDANEVREQLAAANDIIEHLRAQLDANADWEDVSNELTTRCHELEDKVTSQEAVIQDLESLRELNDELETQHIEQEEELRVDLEDKIVELTEQRRRIETQDALIADHEDLITKFRELVFDLQGKMTDAESSRNMTELQVKDTTGRFNEVMDLNRRLCASNVQATTKEITSELRKLQSDEALEQLAILKETASPDFLSSEPLRTYFTAKRVAAKASLLSDLLANTDRQLSYNGGLDEALSRLLCVESIQHLVAVRSGSERISSAIAASPLSEFAAFGPTCPDLITVEKSLDQGLESLRTDTVNFAELAASLQRLSRMLEAISISHKDALLNMPEDVILGRIQNIAASLQYLDSNFAVVNTMLTIVPTLGGQRVLEYFTPVFAECNKTMLSAQKLLRTMVGLRSDRLYPQFILSTEHVIEVEAGITKIARQAAELGKNAVRTVSIHLDGDGTFNDDEFGLDLYQLLEFYWSSDLCRLSNIATQLNDWADEVSVLMNSSEIAHGPTPWSQKAKQVEAARQKNSEAAVLLENLKAEHKATLLNLHERERDIDTKCLEIEHLEAKYRDATSKVNHNQKLHDKVKAAEDEADRLLQLFHSQAQQIQTLEAMSSRISEPTHVPVVLNTTNSAQESVEQTSSSGRLPAGIKCVLDALKQENHWLRRRENRALFEQSMDELEIYIEIADRADRFLAGQMGVEEYYEYTAIEHDDSDDDDDVVQAGMPAESRQEETPWALNKVQTGWRPRANEASWEVLSVIEEDLEGDTLDLEGFSEIGF